MSRVQFTEALAEQGEERGLIGPLELPRLWTRHILNSVIAAPLFHGSVADIGSGAGLPGTGPRDRAPRCALDAHRADGATGHLAQ